MDPSQTWHPGAISLMLLACEDSDCRLAYLDRNGLHGLNPKKLISREPDMVPMGRLHSKVPTLRSICKPTFRPINKVFGTQWVARVLTKKRSQLGNRTWCPAAICSTNPLHLVLSVCQV